MIPKILGAVLILTGCGGFGMIICLTYKREEDMLRQMIHTMDYIQCELQFRLMPLPELCNQASMGSSGKISQFWNGLSEAMLLQKAPDVPYCVKSVMESAGPFPSRVEKVLEILSHSLGQFDSQGQLQALETARDHCRRELNGMRDNREIRLRSYQTLGICAGAALVILLV